MANLNKIINVMKIRQKVNIEDLCKIKKYLTVKEKIEFVEEYRNVLKQHLEDYKGYESLMAFIFFNLMIVKKYTDIELELNFDEFDLLQENELIDIIAEAIGNDYLLMKAFVKMRSHDGINKEDVYGK